jgi:hypothetical protein
MAEIPATTTQADCDGQRLPARLGSCEREAACGGVIEERGNVRHRLFALACALTLGLLTAAPAFGFDCTVAKKPATAGAVGIVDITTDAFTPLKPNPGTEDKPHGAFVALTDGEFSTSTFIRAPGGVLPPVREGGSQHNCDGKGLDSLEVCFGG